MYSKYTGVILKKHPLGEADELLTLYTKEEGKLRVLARGVRRVRSRLAGLLQSLNEIEFETATSGRRASALPVLTSARVKMMNDYLRENLRKYAFAMVGMETLYRATSDGQENAEVYRSFGDFLRLLGETSGENGEVRRFQIRLLKSLGFAPAAWTEEEVSPSRERELDQLLAEVLEREIKSKKFVDQLNN